MIHWRELSLYNGKGIEERKTWIRNTDNRRIGLVTVGEGEEVEEAKKRVPAKTKGDQEAREKRVAEIMIKESRSQDHLHHQMNHGR